MFPKTSAYVKRYDGQTKWMYFLIGYILIYWVIFDLLWKCYLGSNVSADVKKKFDNEPAYNKEYLKTKKILWCWSYSYRFTIK